MHQKTRGAIAAGHPKTAEAGKIMFELGGNAFDAAIAAVLASCVVEPTLASVGGGGFLLAHTGDRQNILFDFFCQTPRQKKTADKIDFYPVEIDFGGEIQIFHIGLGSIAVPGMLAGIFEVHQKLGKLPFKVVSEPAIDYAQNGYIITPFNYFTCQVLEPILTASSESRKIYAPTGKLTETGQTRYIKDFANFLQTIAQKGSKEFYQGEIAHQLSQDLARGGHLTLEDLANYRVSVRNPLKINYRDWEILTNPPPSSGGILIAFALKLLESCDLKGIEFSSCEHLQILAQVMSLTNRARERDYDHYLYHPEISDRFLDSNNIASYQEQLTYSLNKWGSTTHISVIDNEGNAASVTTSNGEGSSYVIPNTGVMLNNMLGEADLNPVGFDQWPGNQRLSSMMSPTIILKNGQPEIVLGSGGSNRIRTAILQVISNLLDFNLTLDEAINSPRVHWENQIFSVEPLSQNEILTCLSLPEATQIIAWPDKSMFFGGVHVVKRTAEGLLEGVGDERRAGVAMF